MLGGGGVDEDGAGEAPLPPLSLQPESAVATATVPPQATVAATVSGRTAVKGGF
jgi:hypothetical protein